MIWKCTGQIVCYLTVGMVEQGHEIYQQTVDSFTAQFKRENEKKKFKIQEKRQKSNKTMDKTQLVGFFSQSDFTHFTISIELISSHFAGKLKILIYTIFLLLVSNIFFFFCFKKKEREQTVIYCFKHKKNSESIV